MLGSHSVNEKVADDSIVYVPCGVTSMRAKKWPIKADLFVMKMNKADCGLELNLVTILISHVTLVVYQRRLLCISNIKSE